MLLSIYIDLCHVEKTKINKKDAGIGPFFLKKNKDGWAVIVAQLVERLLETPEVRCSNPVIGKINIEQCQQYWKDENKEKQGRERPIF